MTDPIDNPSKSSQTDKPQKSSGCGCLWLIALGFIYFIAPNFKITTTASISSNDLTQLKSEAEQIQSQLQARNCNQLLQEGFSSIDDSTSDAFFLELCNQKANEYETAQAIAFQDADCENTIKPFKGEQWTTCTLEYEVVLADGSSLQETYLWILENGQYQFVEVTWEET